MVVVCCCVVLVRSYPGVERERRRFKRYVENSGAFLEAINLATPRPQT